MGGIIEDGKAGINIQEWRQRGRRKLQRSGDVSHGQPNPRSSLDNTFEVVGRASAVLDDSQKGFRQERCDEFQCDEFGKICKNMGGLGIHRKRIH